MKFVIAGLKAWQVLSRKQRESLVPPRFSSSYFPHPCVCVSQNIAKNFQDFAKVEKNCQIWSHWTQVQFLSRSHDNLQLSHSITPFYCLSHSFYLSHSITPSITYLTLSISPTVSLPLLLISLYLSLPLYHSLYRLPHSIYLSHLIFHSFLSLFYS